MPISIGGGSKQKFRADGRAVAAAGHRRRINGLMAIRDAEIAIEKEPARRHDS
jgi:hypothetical protein